MPTTTQRDRSGRRARIIALFAALGLLLSGLALAAPSSAAPPITPTSIDVQVSTDNSPYVGGNPPDVLAKAGDSIYVLLTLQPPGATFNKNTALDLTVVGGTGVFTPSRVSFPKGLNTFEFAVTYSKAEVGIQLNVSPAPSNGKASGLAQNNLSDPFEIQRTLITASAGSPQLASGFGSDVCGQDSPEPLCGIAYLPNGISSEKAALAIADCSPAVPCSPGSQIVSFLAGLGAYSHTNPATVVLRCDKSLCGGGGVSSYTVQAAKFWGEALTAAPACTDKGQVQAGEPYCIDYVQSRRDNAGDLLLYWLVTDDLRGTI